MARDLGVVEFRRSIVGMRTNLASRSFSARQIRATSST